MSTFYRRHLENNGVSKEQMPAFMQHEINNAECHAQHLRQANITTRGKHTGSKSKHKIEYNMHRATNVIKSLMSGYNE